MFAQGAEVREDEEAAGSAAHFVVLELPSGRVRNENGVQPGLQSGIDIAPRTVAHHPTMRFHDVVPVHQVAVRGGIFFRNNLYGLEMNLKS